MDESGTEAGPQLVEENVSGRRESAVLKEEKASPKANDPDAVNHRIGKEDELIAGGDVSKIKANLAALRLLKKLEAENRNATADEKKVLAKYVGWGGLPQVFERGHSNYDELRELLTKEEGESARGSTLNAHYTERGVIEQMWRLAEKLGFKGGKVGEFGAGIGHFLGLVPDSLAAKTKFRAVELDSVTGRMLQKLYPQADVTVAGLEDTRIANNSLSLVIGNFPFAKLGPNDKRYPKFSLHNYFFARAIDAVKPGGLVIALTSNSTLDNAISLGARKWLSERADLVGAIRLPNNAFKKNAGTEVVTDIIVLRKKDGTRFQGEQFELSAETTCADGSGTARINEYYVNHPEMVLGQHSMTGHMHGRADSYTVLPDKSNAFHQELGKRVDELGKRGEVLGTAQETASLENTPDTGNRKFGEYFIRDGKVLMQGKEDAIRMVKVKADVERLRAMAGAHAQQVRGNRSKLSEEQRAMNTMTAVKGALSENMKTFEAFDPKKITLPNGDVVERKDLIAWLDQYLEKHKGAFKFDFSISGIPVQLERYWSELEDTVKLAYTITIPGLKSGYAKYGGEFKNGTGFMQSFASNIGAKAEEAERLDRRMENQRELLKNLEESINAPFAEAKQLEALEAEYMELAGRLTTNEDAKHFDERPDLHDYLDANVDMSAEVEFSEDEEDGEQGDAGKVKMSKPWTGEKEEYPAEWGKCFSQYRGKKYLAVQHLLHRKEGFVPAAFHREDIGDIDIVYGETGEGVEDKRGYGLAHIRKRHPGMDWKLFSQVIQTGELKEINDRRVNIVDGKAKVIIELEWKGQERKWVVSAMGGDLTSTADSLLASNPQEAAKQGIAPKGMVTIGDLWEKSSQKSGKFQENDGGTIKFSIRREEPPKKTRTGYKVFAMFKSHPGELFPPMVANPGGASTPVGVWLNADAAPRAEDSKTGRPRVQSGGKGTNAGKATLAYRPGWHLGPLPEASQFLVKNPETGEAKSMFPENFVFAECEFAADEDYQQEAMSYGYNASGKFQHSLAGLPKVPKDGYYVYRTNPDPKTVPWYISGAMRVKRLLNDRETAEILRENGSRMVPRRGGELDLKAWGFDRTDFTDDGNVKLSKPSAKLSEMTDEAKGFVRSLFTNGGQSKPDVNPWAKTFGTIFHYARQVPSLERMFDAAAELSENKTKLLKRLFNGETGRDIPGELRALEAKQPEEYRKLNDYMLKQDRNRAGGFVHENGTDGKFVACDLEGNAVDWFDSEEAAWERVFAEERKDVVAEGIMGETAAELLYQVRNAFNWSGAAQRRRP